MGEETVKVHGLWCSPYHLRVIWALNYKGIPYEYVEEDLNNKSALLLHYNPVHKKIPVLLHNNKPICESSVILEYIEDLWPHNPLLPTDPYHRATARFWIKFIDDKGVEALRRVFRTRSGGEELEAAVKECFNVLETVEGHALGDKKYFNGDKIGMVDVAFGPIVQSLSVVEHVLGVKILESNNFPRLCTWYQNLVQLPLIREKLPDHDKFITYYENRRRFVLASS